MISRLILCFILIVVHISFGQELAEEDTAVIFNPKPENISLLKNTPPQYKFYVNTPKGSGKKQGDLDQRYRAEQASKQSPQAGESGQGAKARQEGYEKRRGDAKANRNID